MELADLTRGMRKNDFLEPDLFGAKPSFSEFQKSSVEKSFFKSLKNCFSATATHAKPSLLQPEERKIMRKQFFLKARLL